MIFLAIAKILVVGVYELADEIRREVQRERAARAALAPVIDLAKARRARRGRPARAS